MRPLRPTKAGGRRCLLHIEDRIVKSDVVESDRGGRTKARLTDRSRILVRNGGYPSGDFEMKLRTRKAALLAVLLPALLSLALVGCPGTDDQTHVGEPTSTEPTSKPTRSRPSGSGSRNY